MNIIILGKKGQSRRVNLATMPGFAIALLLGTLIVGGSGLLGYELAEQRLADQPLAEIRSFHAEIDEQQNAVRQMREEAKALSGGVYISVGALLIIILLILLL